MDDSPLFASPLRDPDGFWINRVLLKEEIKITQLDSRTANLEFTVPHRLDGHLIRVIANDQLGNQAWQLIHSGRGLNP